MLSCKISGEESNSLELLKENEKVGVTLNQRLMVLQSTLGCPGRSGLMSEGNKELVFHSMWQRMDTSENTAALTLLLAYS